LSSLNRKAPRAAAFRVALDALFCSAYRLGSASPSMLRAAKPLPLIARTTSAIISRPNVVTATGSGAHLNGYLFSRQGRAAKVDRRQCVRAACLQIPKLSAVYTELYSDKDPI
jgi:hypothetical protein